MVKFSLKALIRAISIFGVVFLLKESIEFSKTSIGEPFQSLLLVVLIVIISIAFVFINLIANKLEKRQQRQDESSTNKEN